VAHFFIGSLVLGEVLREHEIMNII
jgi:hypothetical protein